MPSAPGGRTTGRSGKWERWRCAEQFLVPPSYLPTFTQSAVCVYAQRLQFVTPWIAAHQAPLSMGFSRQEYWSGLPCPPPGDLPSPGIKLVFPASPALPVDFLPLSHQGSLHTLSCTSSNPTVVYSLQKKLRS